MLGHRLHRLSLFGLLAGTLLAAPAMAQKYKAAYLPFTPNSSPLSQMLVSGGDGQIAVALTPSFLSSGQSFLYTDTNAAPYEFYGGQIIYGVGGGKQVGIRYSNGYQDAMVWNSDKDTGLSLATDSTTDGYRVVSSVAQDTDGKTAVGWGYLGTSPSGGLANHALLYDLQGGFTDLNPVEGEESYAFGLGGGQQVGITGGLGDSPFREDGFFSSGVHAALWSGDAAFYISLHPLSSFLESRAYATDGTHQVGWGMTDQYFGSSGPQHALLWSGTAASAVDLNPVGFKSSHAYDIAGDQIVGSASPDDGSFFGSGGPRHALLWNNLGSDSLDLQSLLTPDFYSSIAYGFDDTGRIFGTATRLVAGRSFAETVPVVWERISEVPEPGAPLFSAIAVLSLGILIIARRHRRI